MPAPISGRIGRALVTEGALVGNGDATQLATIEQIDPIYANFTQPGGDLLRLQEAVKSGKLKHTESAKVELLLEDGSAYPLPGKILFSDMAVDPTTGAVSLRAEFPNPRHELLPGMFVRIRFPSAVAENAIRVPQRAVQGGPQGQFVMMVAAEGKATPQPVKTGGMAGADFIIAEGLERRRTGDRQRPAEGPSRHAGGQARAVGPKSRPAGTCSSAPAHPLCPGKESASDTKQEG